MGIDLLKRFRKKHKWTACGNPLLTVRDGELYIFVVEVCENTGMYRYVRVPSNKQLVAMEKEE